MAGEIEYEIKPVKHFSLNFKELWEYKELFYFFAWRDIKVKYKQTFLGFTWAVLQPLMMMVIFTLFFAKALHVPSDSLPYPIFVFSGLLIWNIFSSGLSNASNSMINNANIIKKIYFPRLIIPMSSILIAVFDFLMALILFLGILFYYNYQLSLLSLLIVLPLSLIITILATFGLGCFLAALNIKYRDFKYIIPFMIQALLFLTPVIYPISSIKYPVLKYLLAINPLSASINLIRNSLGGQAIDWNLISFGATTSLVLFTVGLLYFRKTEAYFADLA